MITEIKASGFKGMDFEQKLGSKNLIIGRNGTYKSARSAALMLLVLGYVPGVAKKNDEILSTFGNSDKLMVSGLIDKTRFFRRFVRNKKGTVSQDFAINHRKATKAKWMEAMLTAGKPTVLDLGAAFLDLSDQKKIDYIFDLFPPSGDIAKISTDIENKQIDLNQSHADMREQESLIKNLTTARSEIELPAGTLPEIKAAIKKTTEDYRACAKQIAEIEKKEAEEAAVAKAKAEAEAKAKEEKEEAERKAAESEKAAVIDSGPGVHPQNGDMAGNTARTDDLSERTYQHYEKKAEDDVETLRKAAEESLRKKNEKMCIGQGIDYRLQAIDSINHIMTICEMSQNPAGVIACKKQLQLFRVKQDQAA